jgi:hypothetical protein
MSNFRSKKFRGNVYTFDHLEPIKLKTALNAAETLFVDLSIEFGCHCFTEAYDPEKHTPDYRYIHKNEIRAFDILRYQCSLYLPQLVVDLQRGLIYRADDSYTYVARITLTASENDQPYSIFFSLQNLKGAANPALKMFVKSAYVKPLVAKPNAQSWRFASLAGQLSGVFATKGVKPKPEKKKQKAPQGL